MPDYDRDLQTIKEDVRARCDIVEVISQYTQLKRAGKNWTGLCPFHADKRPSFSVSPATQSYRCWSCGEKGDVFTFVQKKENLDFLDALETLAKRVGIPFERHAQSKEQVSEREQMLALNLLAVKFYQERLRLSPEAQEYLTNRAILRQTQEQWDIGFAPPDWEGLTFYLQRQRADLTLAAKMGLIKVRQPGGGFYDTFRNRLMFPIHDVQGRVIAFGGRAMGDDPAKYLNSEQSLLFDKSRTLYGLAFARKKLSAATPAVFVEGYVDVIATHQAGFTQCVATLGTSMTEEHARMLVRYSPRVIICYDADSAGIKATLRGAGVWESVGVEGAEVRVARLPAGDDPDSLLRRGETAAFQAALDNAVPRVDFQIELALLRHDVTSDDGRDQALAEVVPIIASLRSLTQRDRYVQKVAHLHPSYRFSLSRAIDALLSDIQMYARQSHDGQSPRDRGFPLTEQANRGTLANEPSPPAYRPPDAERWGKWEQGAPGSSRKGEGAAGGRPGSYGAGGDWQGRGSSGGRYGKREKRDPLRDYGPPPLISPALSGVEKAERQLLRALFSAEWRTVVLGRLDPSLLITTQGRELFALAARTPAREDGTLDALEVLRQAEESERSFFNASEETQETSSNVAAREAADEGDALGQEPDEEAAGPNSSTSGRNSAKTTEFIREIVEESQSVMSKEPLNEAVLGDCIRRLQQYREELARRELMELLAREDLTPEQRQTYLQQIHQKTRQSRGSPPAAENG